MMNQYEARCAIEMLPVHHIALSAYKMYEFIKFATLAIVPKNNSKFEIAYATENASAVSSVKLRNSQIEWISWKAINEF